MPHRIHAAVETMQAPRRDSSPYRGLVKSKLAQLLDGDDAVLPSRNRRDP
jgi:hypothetical protein